MAQGNKEASTVARQPGIIWDFDKLLFKKGEGLTMGKDKDGNPLTLASILERQWGVEDRQMGLMEDQFTASAAVGVIQGVAQIFGAFMQWGMMNAQIDLQDRAMTLQEGIVEHKKALDLAVLEKQDALANKQLTNQVELARIEKNRAVALAQVQADAKVEIAGKKAVASQFLASYNYGNPYQAVAV